MFLQNNGIYRWEYRESKPIRTPQAMHIPEDKCMCKKCDACRRYHITTCRTRSLTDYSKES
jgi:hypothetical protein